MESTLHAAAQGLDGAIHDMKICSGHWNINWGKVTGKINLWHGGMDKSAPYIMTDKFGKYLKTAQVKYFKEETHMSLLNNHSNEILRSLAE